MSIHWLSIGQCLRAQYDALALPIPPRIAALLDQLDGPNSGTAEPGRNWLDYDPVALGVLVIGICIIELLAFII
jgi:hypothetical protein